jgi:phosphatidylserine decarboxylase
LDRLIDILFVGFQRLLPARSLGRLIYAASRSRARPFKNLLIRAFIRLYRIDLSEAAAASADAYPDFNAFFTRALQPGARPVCSGRESICCPADGTVQQCGPIRGARLMQAKDMTFTLTRLFGGDEPASSAFEDGVFLTVYLAPQNYHRVHMPIGGKLQRTVHVPGRRLAVNQRTIRTVDGVFAANERLVCHFDAQTGPLAIVLVGALNVASISTSWAGELKSPTPGHAVTWQPPAGLPVELNKGDYVGHFNLGSTVIVALPAGAARWEEFVSPGLNVRAGQRLGKLLRA